MFELITPISYWILLALWTVIIVFYIRKLRVSEAAGGAVYTLLLILAIDACRTLFESAYFGVYFNSLYGILPKSLFEVLSNPVLILIPKIINIIAGCLVLYLLIRHWEPVEFRRREEWIKDLEKAKNNAEDHEANLKAILDSISDAIVFTDTERKIISVNLGMYKTFGYSIEDLWGRNTSILYESKEEFDRQGQTRFNLSAEQKLEPYEVRYRRKNGESFYAETLGVAVNDADGNIKGFLGVMRDITQRKQYENELSQHHEHLQDLVDERTKELELITEKANQANQAKSTFLSSMSHELRTPLNAVLGFAQLLETNKNEKLSENQKKYTRQIIEGGDHLLKLINEILDLVKVEAGKISYSIESLDTMVLIDECIQISKPIGSRNQVQVIDKTGDALLPLWADGLRCKQAILNLTSNAIKYNKIGGQVYIETKVLDDDFLRVMVRDTGFGISEENQKLLFEPFQRLGAERTEIEGTGIGLVLTKKYVEEMNGKMGFESKEGKGSTFWIDFPIASQIGKKRQHEIDIVELSSDVSKQEELKDDVISVEQIIDAGNWYSNLLVGYPPIDEDHQQLFKLLDKVSASSISDIEILATLNDLIKYTQYHFEREERIMETSGYDGLYVHRQIHNDFIKKIGNIRKTYGKVSVIIIQDTCRSVLREWLVDHIMSDDKKFAQYFLAKEKQNLKQI